MIETEISGNNRHSIPEKFKPQAVLFDLDGTLIISKIDFYAMTQGVADMAKEYGIEDPILNQIDVLHSIQFCMRNLNPKDASIFQMKSEQLLVDIELSAAKDARPADGALELLQRLTDAQIKVGIVTRNCREYAELVLANYPLPHDLLLTRNDVTKTKPDPEQLLLALKTFQIRPELSLMVGDHQMDIEGGKRAGMKTAGILLPSRPEDFFDGMKPDILVRRLHEITEWIFPSA